MSVSPRERRTAISSALTRCLVIAGTSAAADATVARARSIFASMAGVDEIGGCDAISTVAADSMVALGETVEVGALGKAREPTPVAVTVVPTVALPEVAST